MDFGLPGEILQKGRKTTNVRYQLRKDARYYHVDLIVNDSECLTKRFSNQRSAMFFMAKVIYGDKYAEYEKEILDNM